MYSLAGFQGRRPPPGNTQSTSLSRDRGDRPHRRVARTQRDERRPLRPDPSPPPSLLGSPSCGALADHPPVYPFAGQLLIHELTHACQLDHNNLPVGGGGCSGMSTRPTTSPGTHIHHDGSPYKAVGGIHRTNNRSRSSTSGSVAAGSTPATGPKTGTARTTRVFTTVPGPAPTSPHRSTCPANPPCAGRRVPRRVLSGGIEPTAAPSRMPPPPELR